MKPIMAAILCISAGAIVLPGCNKETLDPGALQQTYPFTIEFAATAGGEEIECGETINGFGPQSTHTVEVGDFRFYVSNLRFYTSDGATATVLLDKNDFQLRSEYGDVALIDLYSNADGACANFAESTQRTNFSVSGSATTQTVERVTFDIGVPQGLMQQVIADHTLEDAPSPLNEMEWNWQLGYRHFVLTALVSDGQGNSGDGIVHLGSFGCGDGTEKALTRKDACDRLNTPAVSLSGFDLDDDIVEVDVDALLADVAFAEAGTQVTSVAISCHAKQSEPSCAPVFENFGMSLATGRSDAAKNDVFAIWE